MNGLKIEEVAVKVGVSSMTINRWYKFKRENPKDSISKTLPAYKMATTSSGCVRIWNPDDVEKLKVFKNNMKYGRTGKLGKYKGEGTKNGKKKDSSRRKTGT